METPAIGHAFDCRDRGTQEIGGERQAREDGLAVHEDGARPALAELAPVLGPREAQVLPQHLEERLVHGHEDLMGLAVDGQGEPSLHPRSCPGAD